jgi:hypothetical protein
MAVKDIFSAETIAEFDVGQVASRHFRALFITTFWSLLGLSVLALLVPRCGARRV